MIKILTFLLFGIFTFNLMPQAFSEDTVDQELGSTIHEDDDTFNENEEENTENDALAVRDSETY